MIRRALTLCLLGCATLAAQITPPPTELPSHPFFIKKTWFIGGAGAWDYLTMDPAAHLLFIAHGQQVQVVDVETGIPTASIGGLHEAHAVALDDSGEFGYISDGPASAVRVFDRRTFQVTASISSAPSPRSLAFEPLSRLLFAVGAEPTAETPANPPPGSGQNRRPPAAGRPAARAPAARPDEKAKSTVTVIDPETRQELAEILLPGRLGFAQSDGNGQVYINVVDRSQVVRLDAQAIGSLLRDLQARNSPQPTGGASGAAKADDKPLFLDWSGDGRQAPSSDARPRYFTLGAECREPRGLAVDERHLRLFAACNNMKMAVLNADNGDPVASLPIGPAPDAIGYDSGRGLIYSANGGAQGSLTIIRQNITDTYAVVQTLATRQRARTLAVDPGTGEVYLVTDLVAVDLSKPGGIGTLKTIPAAGSFQVLVIGN